MQPPLKVVVSTSNFGRSGQRPLQLLAEYGAEVSLNPHGRSLEPPELLDLLNGAAGLVAGTERISREVLAAAPSLRVISRCGAGCDGIDLEAAAELGIEVRTTGGHAIAVAELTVAGMLDVLRRVTYADGLLRQGRWEKPLGRLLHAKTVGIVGLGRVGKAVVRLLKPFEVRLLAHDPMPDVAFAAEMGVEYVALDRLLEESDIVSLHLPYTPAVHHLIDRRRMASMRRGAVLVNTARGSLVDEQALYDRLSDGHLGGAYLDTFEREPYSGPLTQLDSVAMTPHIGSYAREARLAMEVEAVENLLAVLRPDGVQLPCAER
jgi:D-3-phosphoglycerate dehydrogenase